MSDISAVMKAIEGLESKINAYATKAEGEAKAAGSVSADTKAAIEGLGIKQRELADELLQLKQKGIFMPAQAKLVEGWGDQLVKSDMYKAFAGGNATKVRVEVKNTLTGSDTNVAP